MSTFQIPPRTPAKAISQPTAASVIEAAQAVQGHLAGDLHGLETQDGRR